MSHAGLDACIPNMTGDCRLETADFGCKMCLIIYGNPVLKIRVRHLRRYAPLHMTVRVYGTRARNGTVRDASTTIMLRGLGHRAAHCHRHATVASGRVRATSRRLPYYRSHVSPYAAALVHTSLRSGMLQYHCPSHASMSPPTPANTARLEAN